MQDETEHRLSPDKSAIMADNPILPFTAAKPEPTRKIILAGSPVGKTFNETPLIGDTTLIGLDGNPIESTPKQTWDSYCRWRRTKCRPYDYSSGPKIAVDPTLWNGIDSDRALEEIDQAILEFIGEGAELGELFMRNNLNCFYSPVREKLIDECGDILFCGAWALDAWGENPLLLADDLELVRVTDDDDGAVLSRCMAQNPADKCFANKQFTSIVSNIVFNLLIALQSHSGLLANSYKKLRYQRRAQPVEIQVKRIIGALFGVNQILILANSSIEEAIDFNMRKLDARYPEGYKPGQKGGIRTGHGAGPSSDLVY